jgi:uncharacterized protein YkwD
MNRAVPAFAAVCICAVLLMPPPACGKDKDNSVASPEVSRYIDSLDPAKIEQRIHKLVNIERKKHGLTALTWNKSLTELARKYSKDMGLRDYFSHETPEGLDLQARYKRDGVSCGSGGGAENIALEHVYSRCWFTGESANYEWQTAEEIAEETVRGWMDSKGHRANILNPLWRSEGIGVFIRDNGSVYITQNFC